MAHVTILGAGLVAGPLVRHLLESSTHTVTVAARNVERAAKLVNGHPRGRAERFDISDADALDRVVAASDVVVSMLPWTHHVTVADRCIAHKKHLVTTSYVSPAMRERDDAARAAGVVILMELGLDPGIDHMSAMKVIHGVRAKGGRVVEFRSYCGGLPAPEANDNPFGYKFSWSPRGVVLAARNSAKFLKDSAIVEVPGAELFAKPERVAVEGAGEFEGYPNRDSLSYIATYGLEGVRSIFRGTLRNLTHCETWKAMADLGLYDDAPMAAAPTSFRAVMAALAGVAPTDDVEGAVAKKAGLPRESLPLEKLSWLGMFSDDALPADARAPIDALVARLVEKLQYKPGERDMIVLQHEFVAEYPDRTEHIRSTLVDFGIPNGETSMSRTVGLPAAIGVLRVLDGTIATPGVVVPVAPEVYEPILAELEKLGIRFREEVTVR